MRFETVFVLIQNNQKRLPGALRPNQRYLIGSKKVHRYETYPRSAKTGQQTLNNDKVILKTFEKHPECSSWQANQLLSKFM